MGQAIRLPRHGRRNRLPHLSPDVTSITYDLFSEEHRLDSLYYDASEDFQLVDYVGMAHVE